MASLTIRKLDDEVKAALRIRTARAGRSMEEEARLSLEHAVRGMDGPALLERAKALFGPAEAVALEVPPRDASREIPDFEP